MYQKINFHNLQNLELIQFMKSFLEIIAKADPELLKVKAQYDALLTIYTAMHDFYKPELANKLTKQVQNLDANRDQALQGIIDVLRAYQKHYDPVLKAAAELLLNSIDIYGDQIGSFSYQKETAAIGLICTNWNKEDEYANALSSLHLSPWAAKLNEFNTQFEVQYMERMELDAHSPEVKMVDYRKQSYESYKTVLKHMEANAILTGEEPYIDVNKKINQLIDMNNQLIDSRTNKKEETEESTAVE